MAGREPGAPTAEFATTERTRIRRLPERGSYDRAAAYSIIDEALYCHVGFAGKDGPFVIPTIHARHADTLYLHGSPASRMLRTLKGGADVCVSVTLLDGLVLARSAFHHSMNYRSVLVFGRAAEVTDPAAKEEATRVLTEHVLPGRWNDARRPNHQELRATTVLAIPLDEASVKTRTGPPADDPEDMGLGIWAGVLPVTAGYGSPIPDPALEPGVTVPDYLRHASRRRTDRADRRG